MNLPDSFPVPFFYESEIKEMGLSLDDCVSRVTKDMIVYMRKTDVKAEQEWAIAKAAEKAKTND